jgi:mono/diheme cytochrome c family protein
MKTALVKVSIVVACALPLGAALATPRQITLPPDAVQLKPSTLPGYDKAVHNCVTCHSAEYMLYQPASAARPYWEAMTKRMKAVFKAPVEDADMPALVDYLVKTYGNEQPK